MKNDYEMYQSLLSRYEEYQEKKKKRFITIKRTIPVIASFCFALALGVGYQKYYSKIPMIPMQPDIVNETTETTTAASVDADLFPEEVNQPKHTNPFLSEKTEDFDSIEEMFSSKEQLPTPPQKPQTPTSTRPISLNEIPFEQPNTNSQQPKQIDPTTPIIFEN